MYQIRKKGSTLAKHAKHLPFDVSIQMQMRFVPDKAFLTMKFLEQFIVITFDSKSGYMKKFSA